MRDLLNWGQVEPETEQEEDEEEANLSRSDESLVEVLVDLLREDQELLEQTEKQGVAKTIMMMKKQMKLDSWVEHMEPPLIVFIGSEANRDTEKSEEPKDLEMTDQVMEVRPE